jgi:hypothetical protein
MTKSGQRGSRGMRQPPRGFNKLIQPRALIALEQCDHAGDLGALAWHRRRSRRLPNRSVFAAIFAFDESSFVFGATFVLGMDCEWQSSTAIAFSPASVNFNEYAWPLSSSRRQASTPVFALISRTRPAVRSLAATFRAAPVFSVFGAMRQRSLRWDASNKIARCVPVSLAGELIGVTLSVLAALSPSPPRAPDRETSPAGPKNSPIYLIGGSLLQASKRP